MEANKFQQKNIFNYTSNKLNIVVKLVYLQIKHPHFNFGFKFENWIAGFNFSRKIIPYKRTSKVNSICAVVGGLSSW